MTAEIAVMNKQGVALAADSAVTVTGDYGPKIFASANKIFALSKHRPVGVMIFGSADFMQVPWETVIKEYRAQLGRRSFPTLGRYAEDLLAFLRNNRRMFPTASQTAYAVRTVHGYFEFLRGEITQQIGDAIRDEGDVDVERVGSIVDGVIAQQQEAWKGVQDVPDLPATFRQALSKRLQPIVRDAKQHIFERLPLSAAQSRRLSRLALSCFAKVPTPRRGSGIVVSGFGDHDIFPTLRSYQLDGLIQNRLVYGLGTQVEITADDDAYIVPFAQSEMVATFMEGIDPSLEDLLGSAIARVARRYPEVLLEQLPENARTDELDERLEVLRRELLEGLESEVQEYKHDNYVSPVLSVVASLPKDELAAMAEALVNLTSFKRRVSMDLETVGGPIDVAVISKGDGFIWVKRKHYFDPRLNQQFFATYYQEEEQDGE